MRLNMNLAKKENSELVLDQVVGIANDGETPIIQKTISPFIELKDRLQNRKSKIIKLMVGDRQEKYKKEAALKIKIDADPSSKMSAMRAKLDSLSREMNSLDRQGLSPQEVIDADFEE